jgi:hypothetical protein
MLRVMTWSISSPSCLSRPTSKSWPGKKITSVISDLVVRLLVLGIAECPRQALFDNIELAERSWVNEQYLEELEHVESDDVVNFFPQLLEQTHIEGGKVILRRKYHCDGGRGRPPKIFSTESVIRRASSLSPVA